MTIRIRKGLLPFAIASLLAAPAVMAQNAASPVVPGEVAGTHSQPFLSDASSPASATLQARRQESTRERQATQKQASKQQTSKKPPGQKTHVKVQTLSAIEVVARELTLLHTPMDSTFSASVIGPSAIRFASPMLSVEGLLERTPSINVRTPAPNGMRSHITFRAFNSGQFAETFDGVPINDAMNGGATNAASTRNNVPLTLNDISSVNIYRGINNPAVTSYDSLGGTIAYEPRDPTVKPNASAALGGGSFHTWFYGITANTGQIGPVRNLISVKHNASHGWQRNAGNRNTNLYYAGDLPYDNGKGSLYAYVIYNRNKGYTPHTVPLPLIKKFGYHYGWPRNWDQSINKDHTGTDILGDRMEVNNVLSFNVRMYVKDANYIRTSYSNPAFSQSATQPYFLPNQPYTFPYSPTPFNTYDPIALFGSYAAGNAYHTYVNNEQRYGFMPSVTLYLPHNTVKLGADYSYTRLHSKEYWYGARKMPKRDGYNDAWSEYDGRELGSYFVQDKISLFNGVLHVTPGVKFLKVSTRNHNKAGFFDVAGFISGRAHFTSPTLGLNWRPIHDISLYASWGKASKFPGISTFYSNIETNSQGAAVVVPIRVKPEYVNDIEVGARYHHHGFEAALNAYRENFTNTFISITNRQTLLTTTRNGGSSRYKGLELTLQNTVRTPYGDFSVFGNASDNRANFTSNFTVGAGVGNAAGGDAVTAGEPLAGVPHHLANLGIGWKWHSWRANLNVHYSSSKYVSQFTVGLASGLKTPSYTVVNFTVRDTIPIDDGIWKDVKVALYVDNVLDRHYFTFGYADTTYSGTPFVRAIFAEPRAYFASVTFDF